jgi:hypothetical protein
LRTISVGPAEFDAAVRRYASAGLVVTARGSTWATLQRPPGRAPRTLWRAVKLTVLTLGLYPLAVALWWLAFAWWVRPIVAAARPSAVTVQVIPGQPV